ncbi:13689_t:CDS:1 [Acaulospora colombiana]|uniref:13689_t:CDS:1 n=1 Tax=Acaulospora colombiana TaxID=27376 RepID=A0ACA9P556_9GLOM|nr:13689_t:CDS:1 [Acaulospora colombiana]
MDNEGDQKKIPLNESPFNYAVTYWLKHAMDVPHGVEATSSSKELWTLVKDFFWDRDGAVYMEWLRILDDTSANWHSVYSKSKGSVMRSLRSSEREFQVDTRLEVVASYGLVDIIEWAHPDGTNFDIPRDNGYSPLMAAVASEEEEVTQALLSQNSVCVNRTACHISTTGPCSGGECGSHGSTALMSAVGCYRLGVMKLLLEHPDIEVDLVSHGRTALGVAIHEIRHGREPIKLLLSAGAKLAMYDGNALPIPSVDE